MTPCLKYTHSNSLNALDTKQLENSCGNTSRCSVQESHTQNKLSYIPQVKKTSQYRPNGLSRCRFQLHLSQPTTYHTSRSHMINASLSRQKQNTFVHFCPGNQPQSTKTASTDISSQTSKVRLISNTQTNFFE